MAKGRLEKTPQNIIAKYRILVDNLERNIESSIRNYILKVRNDYEKKVALLDSFSPLKTLKRGYSVAIKQDGRLVSKIEDIQKNELVHIRVTNGNILTKVIEKSEEIE